MQPKPEGDFTAKCRHCNVIQVNKIHTYLGNLSAMFSRSKHDHITFRKLFGQGRVNFSKCTPNSPSTQASASLVLLKLPVCIRKISYFHSWILCRLVRARRWFELCSLLPGAISQLWYSLMRLILCCPNVQMENMRLLVELKRNSLSSWYVWLYLIMLYSLNMKHKHALFCICWWLRLCFNRIGQC